MSPAAAVELRAEGHDVIWAGAWPVDPGDDEVLRRAHAEGRVLITLDKDFGELAVALRRPHAGIVRLVGFLAAFAKAVGHPIRMRILRMLARKDARMCSHIVDELPLAQSTVSEHLRILRSAGLVKANEHLDRMEARPAEWLQASGAADAVRRVLRVPGAGKRIAHVPVSIGVSVPDLAQLMKRTSPAFR